MNEQQDLPALVVAVRARLAAATLGAGCNRVTWFRSGRFKVAAVADPILPIADVVEDDAILIACAPTDLAALCDVVERLMVERDEAVRDRQLAAHDLMRACEERFGARRTMNDKCNCHGFLAERCPNAPPIAKASIREKGTKHDAGKPRWSLLPAGTISMVLAVLEFGAAKYGVGNWQHVPDARTRYYDAAMRHINAWLDDPTDDESGQHHLGHAVCCLLYLMWFDKNGEK